MLSFKNIADGNLSYLKKFSYSLTLAVLTLATGAFGILMLYSVAGGSMLLRRNLNLWICGRFGMMAIISFIHIDFGAL